MKSAGQEAVLIELDNLQQTAELMARLVVGIRRVLRQVLRGERENDKANKQHDGNALCIFLQGDLGAGKTELCRQIINSFNQQEAAGGEETPTDKNNAVSSIEVTSPSYSIVQTYKLGNPGAGERSWVIHHLDVYRLREPAELHSIGIEDYLSDADLMLVEWGGAGDKNKGEDKCGDVIKPDLIIKIEMPKQHFREPKPEEYLQQQLTNLNNQQRVVNISAISLLGKKVCTD